MLSLKIDLLKLKLKLYNMNLYSILVTILLAVIWYKNYQGKKLFKKLKIELSETHNFYREKYDFYLNFKDRYWDTVNEVSELKELLATIPQPTEDFLKPLEEKQIEALPVITKPKRVRKPKVE